MHKKYFFITVCIFSSFLYGMSVNEFPIGLYIQEMYNKYPHKRDHLEKARDCVTHNEKIKALIYIAIVHKELRNHDQAIEILQHVVAHGNQQNKATAFLNYALICLEQNKPKEALCAWEHAFNYGNTSIQKQVLWYTGCTFEKTKDYYNAIRTFRYMLKVDPETKLYVLPKLAKLYCTYYQNFGHSISLEFFLSNAFILGDAIRRSVALFIVGQHYEKENKLKEAAQCYRKSHTLLEQLNTSNTHYQIT